MTHPSLVDAPRAPKASPWSGHSRFVPVTTQEKSSCLLTGWLVHAIAMYLLGSYQQAYRHSLAATVNDPLMWLIHATANPTMDRWMATITDLGNGSVIALSALTLILIAIRRSGGMFGLRIFTVVAGSALLAGFGKAAVYSPRPQLWTTLQHFGGSSFPSSHASASLSLAALVMLLAIPWRQWLTIPAMVAVFGVGYSRVYLGAHAPTDILLTWLIIGSWTLWTQRCLGQAPSTVSYPTSVLGKPAAQ